MRRVLLKAPCVLFAHNVVPEKGFDRGVKLVSALQEIEFEDE
jgi:hypothetical protein